MKTKKSYGEEITLNKYQASLDSVKSKKPIQDLLSNFGYTAEYIAEGQTLLHETWNAIEEKEIEHNKRYAAYQAFRSECDELSESYNLHRKIAKVIFRKDPISLEKLAINGYKPFAYEEWIETNKKFYAVATNDSDIQSELARFRLTPEKMESAKVLIASVETARAHYINQKLEAHRSIRLKDEALENIADWMQVFYTVAKLAIEDQTELQQTLGKTVGA